MWSSTCHMHLQALDHSIFNRDLTVNLLKSMLSSLCSLILLPFLVVGHAHTQLASFDCGLHRKGQIYLSELQIIPFGLWLSIQVVKQSKKLPTKPQLSGLKLVQTSYWGCR